MISSLMSGTAWALDLPSTEKLTLLALIHGADTSGRSRLRIADLVELTGLSERAVQRCVRELDSYGLIHRYASAGRGVIYDLNPLLAGTREIDEKSARLRALQRDCPTCGAMRWEQCIGARGKSRIAVHRDRYGGDPG